MIVSKFGGSSLSDATCINQVVQIIKKYKQNQQDLIVVVSAFGGVTDSLLKMAKQAADRDQSYLQLFEAFRDRQNDIIHGTCANRLVNSTKSACETINVNLANLLKGIYLLGEISRRTLDHVVSTGERISSIVLSQALNSHSILSEAADARSFIKTNETFGKANVIQDETQKLTKEYFLERNSKTTFVVTGFISSTLNNLTTTLGRGGSDYTASILANTLQADQIDIWSDVDGILTANPTKVTEAFTIPLLSYEEAMELSHFGAKVIYPPTIIPALKANIPIYLKNTFNPDFIGSKISRHSPIDEGIIKGISSLSSQSIVTIEGPGMVGVPGIAAKTFGAIAEKGINISLITQSSSEHSISFTVEKNQSLVAKKALESAFDRELSQGKINPIKVQHNYSIVAAIGENMCYQPGVAARTFTALGRNGINVSAIAQGSSERNISIVIKDDDEKKTLNALHESLFLSKNKEINLFIIGVGLIGSTLLNQILHQHSKLIENQNLAIRIVGLANSKKMVFDEKGIDLTKWQNLLSDGKDMDNKLFVKTMFEINSRNSIFIDNTANPAISNLYADILNNAISISTPNKIASSSLYSDFIELKQIAARRGVHYLFETNVAAGLPILTTLADMLNSGDRIHRIQAVLSGSLSYIFNNFSADISFHAIVKKAKELGLTEPDPREDLSGSDVARKVLILGRTIGLPLEVEHIKIENFIPKQIMESATVEEFFEKLETNNSTFESLKQHAGNKKIRLIANIEQGNCNIKLHFVEESNPFYNLSGSDNMVVIQSDRYNTQPLVIKGPGAGAEVTAAGVFSEIIRIANKLDN